MDLGSAMERAQVLEWNLQEQLLPYMRCMKPRPSIYIPDFIAANQESRANNVLSGSMAEQVVPRSSQTLFDAFNQTVPRVSLNLPQWFRRWSRSETT